MAAALLFGLFNALFLLKVKGRELWPRHWCSAYSCSLPGRSSVEGCLEKLSFQNLRFCWKPLDGHRLQPSLRYPGCLPPRIHARLVPVRPTVSGYRVTPREMPPSDRCPPSRSAGREVLEVLTEEDPPKVAPPSWVAASALVTSLPASPLQRLVAVAYSA